MQLKLVSDRDRSVRHVSLPVSVFRRLLLLWTAMQLLTATESRSLQMVVSKYSGDVTKAIAAGANVA